MNAQADNPPNKLWSLSAMISKSIPGGMSHNNCLGYRVSTSEDAARGSFISWVFSEYPGFGVNNLLCLEIPRETMRSVMGLPEHGLDEQEEIRPPGP